MQTHKWHQIYINPQGTYLGVTTVILTHKCELCHREEDLPLNATPTLDGCVPCAKAKEKWKHPIKDKTPATKDYPAKREVRLKGRK